MTPLQQQETPPVIAEVIPPTTEEAPKSLLDDSKTDDPPVVVEPLTAEQIQLPEGFEAQPELISEFVDLMNNAELSASDRANALIALQSKTLAAASEANSKAWDDMQTDWQTEVKADPDIGGAKLQPTLANVSKLLSEYGSDELLSVMNVTGAGNNLHVIKFLNTIAGKLTEGGVVQGAPVSGDKSLASSMYPSMKG
jgi:hypothetical protein